MRIDTSKSPSPDVAALMDAAQNGPVFLERGETDVAVVISAEQYSRMRRVAVSELLEFCDRMSDKAAANGLTEEKLEELLSDV